MITILCNTESFAQEYLNISSDMPSTIPSFRSTMGKGKSGVICNIQKAGVVNMQLPEPRKNKYISE